MSTEKKKTISFDEISVKMFGHYWDQTFFWEFKNQVQKKVEIVEIVKNCIKKYRVKSNQPKRYLDIKKRSEIEIPIEKISGILNQDVSRRFLILEGFLKIFIG